MAYLPLLHGSGKNTGYVLLANNLIECMAAVLTVQRLAWRLVQSIYYNR